MLPTTADFPFPGSICEFEGRRWRILQSLPGGEALLGAQGPGASFTRRAPLADLADPDAADLNAEGLDRPSIVTLKWLRDLLRHANTAIFEEIKTSLWTASMLGKANRVDPVVLAGLMRRLGWARLRLEHRNGERITTWHRLPAGRA